MIEGERTEMIRRLLTVAVIALFLQSAGAQTTNTTIDGTSSDPNPYGYGRFTPSMAILLAIFIVVVFLMGFFAIYIRHCSAAARGTVSPSGIGHRASNQRGIDPSILNTFPTFSYSEVKSHKIGKGALECAVCLTEFDAEETLRLLPKCDHVFHQDCIDLWLASHSTCPVCRADLNQLPEASTRVEAVNENEPPAVESVAVAISEPESIDRSESSNCVRPQKMKARTNADAFVAFSKFPRSNSTGHCLVQPGENVDRFTLKLPSEIRNQIMNRGLNRSSSVVVLPSENSLRKGYRDGGPMDRVAEDRWWWSGLFVRNGSSVKSGLGEGTSRIMGFVRQMSVKGFGSRKDRSGSVRGYKSTRPPV